MNVTDPVVAWHTEHAYFKQLLRLLHREIEVFHTEAHPNYDLMLDILSYLRDYGDVFHHPREDVAFARLLRRCPELELPLARLRREHRVIAHAGEKLKNLLAAVLAETVVPVAELETAAATYLLYYGNHISKEEEDILPRAARVLTTEDWKAVTMAVPAEHDPLLAEHREERFRELRRLISREA